MLTRLVPLELKPLHLNALTLLAALALTTPVLRAAEPEFLAWAPTPPMGWNSYDAFGASVTEDEMLANAAYMKDHLLSHGWTYVVVDYRWSDADAAKHNKDGVAGAPLAMDGNGRLLPAPSRFPSAADGNGFKGLADKIHAMGLKFGIHVMRGIPRLAVKANLPIENSTFNAADAADTSSNCGWCPDMYGVKGDTEAGQAYYDSILRLYASWGVDFVKVDDLSNPYHQSEIEAIRKSIDRCGRPIVFSTSPGETPVNKAAHIVNHANMWRVSGDFWDNWKSLNHAFDLAKAWQGVGGPGHWPDQDMIPIGKIGIRSVGKPRLTAFTPDEQVTLLSLWSLAPSPLMLGTNLTELDDATLARITNDEVLEIDQDTLGHPARLVAQQDQTEVWIRDLKDGSKAVGLFNRGVKNATATLRWAEAGLTGSWKVRDVWVHQDLDSAHDQVSRTLPRHGAMLLRLSQ